MHPQLSVGGGAKMRKTARLFQTTPQVISAMITALLAPIALLSGLWLLPWLVERLLNAFGGVPYLAVNLVACAFRIAGLYLSVAVCAQRSRTRMKSTAQTQLRPRCAARRS